MVWVGRSFLWCTIFFVFLLCHPVLAMPMAMVSERSGSSRHVTYVSRHSALPLALALKNAVTSETADVPPFLLVQIIFYCAGCLVEGCQHPWHPPPLAPPLALSGITVIALP